MKFVPLPLASAYQVDLNKHEDSRGFFARQFCQKEFQAHGLNTDWVQMNISHSAQSGTVRGLHFQRAPEAEVKMVRCLKGAIFDVIVDLRDSSPSYGKWYGTELSSQNRSMLYIPKGFAHGFQTLEPETELLYWHSAFYSPVSEGGLNPECKTLNINWPLTITEMSARDTYFPGLTELDTTF